jgi:hypothetical protein
MKCHRCSFDNPSDTNYCGRCGMSLGADQQETFVYDKDTLQYIMEGIHHGSVIADRYEVIEELGTGGMGTVYKVFDKKIEEKVALKLIRPEIAFDAPTVERFGNELKLARKVTHRNICRLYDMGEHGKLHFITMEYVSGQDLKRMIRMSRELSVGTSVAIARQICEGLAESHRLGVVHRDLKPQNIMIDNDGNVKIMDFGIARSLFVKGVTMTGVLVGTPDYMSPEQAEASDVDLRTDIYALGVILYEMVTGQVPFRGETPLSIAIKHREEIPRDPCELNVQVSEDLCSVILRCLEKKKENRYSSAESLLQDLSRIEQGIPTIERVIPKSKRKTDTSREVTVTFRPRKFLLGGAFIVIIVAAALFIWLQNRSRDPQVIKGESPFKNLVVSEKPGSVERTRPESPEAVEHAEEGTGRAFTIPEFSLPREIRSINIKDIPNLLQFSERYLGRNAPDSQRAKGILSVLSLGASNILKELSEKDVEGFIQGVDKALESLDADDPFKEKWQSVASDLKKWNDMRKQGKDREARYFYGSALNKINRLIPQIQVKDSAEISRRKIKTTLEEQAPEQTAQPKNLLFDLASHAVKDADQAYKQQQFDKAGILYTLGGEIFSLSRDCREEMECLMKLRQLVEKRLAKAKAVESGKVLEMYTDAQRQQAHAEEHVSSKLYSEASRYYLQAAVLYDLSVQSYQDTQ